MPCGTLTEGSLSRNLEEVTVTRSSECSLSPFSMNIERDIEYRKTTGECIPRFHARKKRGELLPHTYFSQLEISGKSWGSMDYTHTLDGCRTYTTDYGHRDTRDFPWVPSEEELRAKVPEFSYEIQKAAAAIQNSGHDSLTFLAELAKTKRMVKNLLTSIATGRFDFSIISVPGKWLELRYGWRTLLYDIEELNSVLNEFESARTRYSQNSGTSFTSEFTSDVWYAWDNGNARESCWYTDEISVSVRGSVTADISPPRFSVNPVTTAWELVPFSFVIDWLINIGMYLSSLTFLATSSKHVASGGYRVEIKRRQYGVPEIYNSNSYPWAYGENYKSESNCVAVLSERIPSSVSLLPQSKLRLNEFKILDLIALIYQRVH